MSEGGMTLVGKLLQSQHGSIPTVCERSLQQLEDLSKRDTVVTIVTMLNVKPEERADTNRRFDNHATLSYDKRV